MTDQTPIPDQQQAAGLNILTVDQVKDLEQKVRENKAAQLRGDPLPHLITPEMLRDAIAGIRMQRGTLPLQAGGTGGGKKKGGGKATAIEINLDL